MEAVLAYLLFLLLGLWVVFWLIRLAVRYGVEDALRRNRAWLRPDLESRTTLKR